MNLKNIFLASLSFTLFSACSNDPLNVKPEAKNLGISFLNLDSVLVHTSPENLKAVLNQQQLKPKQILDYMLGHCWFVGELSDTSTLRRIDQFLHDPYLSRLEQRIQQKFSKLTEEKTKISEGFLYLNHHFPKAPIPKNVVFMNSFFASNVFCTEDEVGIGLERYLGPETDVIKELPSQQFFQWIKDEMQAEYMERDVLTAWILTHLVPEANENIADAIVRWGKVIYLTEASFPKEKKHLIMRYTTSELIWAKDNESAFWKYLVNEKLLFSKDERQQANFLNDAPFTIGLPEKGPDRLGQYLGWQMVHSYMDKYPNTSLPELLKVPYNQILQAYKVK